jgi:hypothetical protein
VEALAFLELSGSVPVKLLDKVPEVWNTMREDGFFPVLSDRSFVSRSNIDRWSITGKAPATLSAR